MALTSVTFPGLTGTRAEFEIPFGYISPRHIRCFLAGVTLDPSLYTISGTKVTFITQPYPIGDLEISRYTNVEGKVTDFQKASAIRTSDLNTQNNQFLYAIQELKARGGAGNSGGGDGGNGGGGVNDPVVTDPDNELPLIDYISKRIAEYDLQVQSALANLDAAQSTFQSRLDTFDTDLSGYQTTLNQFTANLNGRIDQLEVVNDDIAALVSQLQTTTEHNSATIRNLQLTTAEGQASLVIELDSRVGSLESNIITVQSVQGDLAQRMTNIESSDGESKSAIQTLQETTANHTTILSNQQTEVDGALSQIGSLKTTQATFSSQLETQSTRIGDTENEIASLQITNGQTASRVSNVESSTGDLTSRVSTLEQTTTAGDAVRINQLETATADIQNRITSVENTTVDFSTRISQVESNGSDYSSRISTLETTQAGQANTISSLNARLGSAEADITTTQNVAAEADGKASAIYGLSLNVNGHINGFKLSNDGSRSDMTVTSNTFRIARPGHSPQTIFSVNTRTGRVSAPSLEVDTIKAQSITTEELQVGSVSETAVSKTTVVPLPSNGSKVTLASQSFTKARGGFMRIEFTTDIHVNTGTEVGVEVDIVVNGTPRRTLYYKPGNWFIESLVGFDVMLQQDGPVNAQIRARCSNAQGGVSGLTAHNSTIIISDLKA